MRDTVLLLLLQDHVNVNVRHQVGRSHPKGVFEVGVRQGIPVLVLGVLHLGKELLAHISAAKHGKTLLGMLDHVGEALAWQALVELSSTQ